MIKIAFDYDDTLDLNYSFFSDLTSALKIARWEIHIVTDIPEEYRDWRKKELEENDITYDILAITGEKLKYCQDNDITYIFDDCSDYYKGESVSYLKLFNISKKVFSKS